MVVGSMCVCRFSDGCCSGGTMLTCHGMNKGGGGGHLNVLMWNCFDEATSA